MLSADWRDGSNFPTPLLKTTLDKGSNWFLLQPYWAIIIVLTASAVQYIFYLFVFLDCRYYGDYFCSSIHHCPSLAIVVFIIVYLSTGLHAPDTINFFCIVIFFYPTYPCQSSLNLSPIFSKSTLPKTSKLSDYTFICPFRFYLIDYSTNILYSFFPSSYFKISVQLPPNLYCFLIKYLIFFS